MRITKAITKYLTGAALAGALLLAAPHKAEAQVSFGIHVGGPVVAPYPAYGYAGYRPYPYYGYRPYYGYYGRPYGYGYGYGRPYGGYYRGYHGYGRGYGRRW